MSELTREQIEAQKRYMPSLERLCDMALRTHDAEQRAEQAEQERDNLRETRQIEIRATEQWREKAYEARQEAAKLRDALQKTRDSLKAAANGSLDRRAQMNDVYNADEALQSAPPASELHKSKRCIACGNVGCWGYRNHCTVCTKCGHPYVPASEPNGVDNFLSEMEADIDATSDEELRAEAAEYGATADDVRIWLDEAIDLTADRPEPSEALKEAQGALFRLKCRAERGEDRLLHGDLGASEEDAAIIRPFLSQPAPASEPDKRPPHPGDAIDGGNPLAEPTPLCDGCGNDPSSCKCPEDRPEPSEALTKQLFWAIANYESDEPYEDGEYVSTPFTPEDLETYKGSLHRGDCTNEPMTCMRCFADHCWHKAQWIARQLSQPAPAVPEVVRQLPGKYRDRANTCKISAERDQNCQDHGIAELKIHRACIYEQFADELERALATHPADGDSPAVPEYARQRLWKIHGVLDRALGDTDCDWYETDDEMREEVPVQWAAKEIAHLAAAPTPTGGE